MSWFRKSLNRLCQLFVDLTYADRDICLNAVNTFRDRLYLLYVGSFYE